MTAALDVSAAADATQTPAADPRVRTTIAVLMTRFPRIDETFILREIDELERHGQPVLVVPLLRDRGRVVHEEAKPWVRRALYLPLLSPEILLSNVRSFFKDPRRYVHLLLHLMAATMLRPSTLVRTLALFPKAVHLSLVLPKRGIRHLHSHFASHATTMAYIIASLSEITYSFTVHGPDVFVHRLLLPEKIEKATFVRCISTFNKAFLCGLYPALTEGKLEVVHTGVNPDVYARAAEEVERPPKTRPRILSVAALLPSRGFEFLVDACARLVRGGTDLECTIVGEGPLRRSTEAWIADHQLADNVKLTGLLPQHEVAKLMAESDLFVFPNIIAVDGQMDGIPVSLMEAMAAGKPVVASAISGIPELVRHEASGILVDSAHPSRLAAAMQRLISDPNLRARMGRAGQDKVRREFDVRKNAAKLIALLDSHGEVNTPRRAAERIARLNWSRLDACAIGVRRIYEAQESFVAEVAITDGITRRDVIVRQHRDGDDERTPLARARHEFENFSLLRQTLQPEDMSMGGTIYTVPRVLMFDEPHAAIVLARADGQSLAGYLQGARRGRVTRLAAALHKAGTWLRMMQDGTRGADDGRHVLTALVLLALRDLDLAAAGDATLRRHHASIVERLQRLEAAVAERPLPIVGQHGSYIPANIFIGDRRVEVVDLGGFREGLAMEDVAQLLLHLQLETDVSLLRRQRARLRAVFLEGYASPVDDAALQLFTLTKALQLLAHGGGAHRRALRKLVIDSQ
ncbi:MAG: glycosyltransferase [Acidobacteria bacterium]|nr:glycosyltransferase [Acidobacteriota bacterium]MBV9478295.1 glycosyltransferase [Acidobacteriota bacterium]